MTLDDAIERYAAVVFEDKGRFLIDRLRRPGFSQSNRAELRISKGNRACL